MPESVQHLMKDLCFEKMAQILYREKALPTNIDAQILLADKSWRKCLTVAVGVADHGAISRACGDSYVRAVDFVDDRRLWNCQQLEWRSISQKHRLRIMP